MLVEHELSSWDLEDCNSFIVDRKLAIDLDFWGSSCIGVDLVIE